MSNLPISDNYLGFNSFHCTGGTGCLMRSNFCLSNLPIPENYLDSIHFTVQDVLDALCNLDPNKACGIDNNPPIVLKNCAHALVLPIHHLFTTNINSDTIPTEWKMHKIIAAYKSGDKTSVKNYHPAGFSGI